MNLQSSLLPFYHSRTHLLSICLIVFLSRSMEAQQVVVMQAEASLEEEKVRSEEYLAITRKYKERMEEMEVSQNEIISYVTLAKGKKG